MPRTAHAAIKPAMIQRVHQDLPVSREPTLLPLQAGENLPLPALLDSLDSHRGEVYRHSVVEPRAEERVHMRVGGAVLTAVLMDCEDALGTSSGAAEGLLDGVAQDALGRVPVEAPETLRRGVVDGQDQAEVGGVPEAAAVATKGFADGRLVAPEGPIPLAD